MPVTASSRLPLAVFLIILAAALLLSLSCPAAAAAAMDYGGGRVGTTIDGHGTSRVAAAGGGAGAAPGSKWQRRRVEEAVAPEFGSVLAADQGYISYNTLNNNRQACSGSCAARGGSYNSQCLAIYQCRG